MLNSNERMGFIIEYMSSYDEKIKMANKNGLFDAAKMFELFAIEVCNVWFGQKFSNLNDETATYPYVDLISENRELLVQVSTVQDVPCGRMLFHNYNVFNQYCNKSSSFEELYSKLSFFCLLFFQESK